MLYTIAVALIIMWLPGTVSSVAVGGFIHIPPVVAVIVIVIVIVLQVFRGRGA